MCVGGRQERGRVCGRVRAWGGGSKLAKEKIKASLISARENFEILPTPKFNPLTYPKSLRLILLQVEGVKNVYFSCFLQTFLQKMK